MMRNIRLFWGYAWRFGGPDWGPRGPRWPIYAPMAWMKWVEKKDGCPFLFLFVHKLVRQSLCPSIRPSLQKLMRIDFMLFASFWKKGGGVAATPGLLWIVLKIEICFSIIKISYTPASHVWGS